MRSRALLLLIVLMASLLATGSASSSSPDATDRVPLLAPGFDRPGILVSSPTLAKVYDLLEENRMAAADSTIRLFLERVESAASVDSVLLSETLQMLARTMKLGDNVSDPMARESARRAAAIKLRIFGPEDLSYASSLLTLGGLEWRLGDYPTARAHYVQALAIAERRLPPESAQLAPFLNGLAIILDDSGEYKDAKPLYERVLRLRESQTPPDSIRYAGDLHNYACLLSATGETDKASALFRRSMGIRERWRGPDHPEVAASLQALSSVSSNPAEALSLLERALAIRIARLGPKHPDVGTNYRSLASVAREMGNEARALEYLQQALTIHERSQGHDHPTTATDLSLLSDVHEALGDTATASALCKEALAIRIRCLGSVHPEVATAELAMAQLLRRRGQIWPALQYALEAERCWRRVIRLSIQGLSEEHALRFSGSEVEGVDLAMSALISSHRASGSDARLVWDEAARSRGIVLDEMMTRRRALADRCAPETDSAVFAWAEASRRLATLVISGPGRSGLEAYRRTLDRAWEEKEAAQEAAARLCAPLRHSLQLSEAPIDSVFAAVPAGGALVAFIRYVEEGSSREEDTAYAAFVFRQGDRQVSLVPLGPAAKIDSLAQEWLGSIASGSHALFRREAEIRSRTVGRDLRALVWDPLLETIAGSDPVVLVPDGELNLISFECLPVASSSYLIEDAPLLHYLACERDLLRPHDDVPQRSRLIALGAPDFDAASAENVRAARAESSAKALPQPLLASLAAEAPDLRCFDALRFAALAGTAEEARTVATCWSSSIDSAGERPVLLLGAAASEANLRALAPEAACLHIATHGFFLGDECGHASAWRNSLLLSGLAFAGANLRGANHQDDGILTAEEACTLDLQGLRCLVLSACNSGAGAASTGEGVFGLRRAFFVAGARSLVVSLWDVEDQAGVRWSRAFYHTLAQSHASDIPACVRRASIESLLGRRRAGLDTFPSSWGGFVAYGDWTFIR